jgi:hypothetical protein
MPPDKINNTHHLSLRDQLSGIKLRNNALQHFISDGREDPLVVVHSKALVDFRQVIDIWAGEDAEGQSHHLQIF